MTADILVDACNTKLQQLVATDKNFEYLKHWFQNNAGHLIGAASEAE